jgi:hypothetical protein
MADGTGYTVVSPDEWAKSFAAKATGTSTDVSLKPSGFKIVGPDEWRKSYAARSSVASEPSALSKVGGAAKYIGQKTAVEGAGLAPVIGGGAMGAELGALGGPAAPITVPLGALIGAAAGGFASPAAEHAASTMVGLPSRPPSFQQAAQGAKSGALSEMTGQIAGAAAPLLGAVKRAFTGEADIGKTADEAAAKATAENTAEQQKLDAAATKESLAQKRASAQAAEAKGQANLGERTGLYDKVVATRQATLDAQSAAQQQADQTVAKAREKLTKDIEPEARAETIKSTLVPPSGQATLEQGPERIARGEQFREMTLGPLERWRSDWAARRDTAIAPMGDVQVDAVPLRENVAKERQQWGDVNPPYSPRVNALLNKVSTEAKPPTDDELLNFAGYKPEETELWKPEYKATVAKQFRGTWDEQHQAQNPTVRELLGWQSEANKIARASKGADRTAALKVVRGVDDTLSSVEVPSLKGINAEYRDHRAHFPYAFEDAVQGAARPVDAAKQIFGSEERVRDLMKLGTPEEQRHLRTLFSDYVSDEGEKAVTPETLKALGYTGPLTKPEAWVYAKNTVNQLGDMFDSAPAAKAKFDAAMADAKRGAMDEYATSVIKAARKDLKSLGPVGANIQRTIDAAPTLEAKATAAIKAMQGMKPEDAVSQFAKTQESPGAAAYGKAIAAPRGARQAAQGFVGQDPTQQALKAITEYKRPYGLADRWNRRAEFWLPLVGATAAAGHPSTYAAGGLMMGAPILAREATAAAYRSSLRDPQAALEFYRALQNPGTPQGLKTLAKFATQATVMSRMPQDNPEPKSSVMSDMADQIASTRAKNIAGPQASTNKIDTVKDLDKEVRAGKTPDVQKELSSGRLSTGNVRKMLDGSAPSITSMFEGLTPDQSIDALAKATPEEKATFIPIVAQRINDQGSKMPKLEQQALLARLKQVMQEGEAG